MSSCSKPNESNSKKPDADTVCYCQLLLILLERIVLTINLYIQALLYKIYSVTAIRKYLKLHKRNPSLIHLNARCNSLVISLGFRKNAVHHLPEAG